MKSIHVLFILFGLFFSSCEDLLPGPSSDSSFGCKINGKQFKPRNSDFKKTPTYAYKKDNILVIKGYISSNGMFELVEIGIMNFSGRKTYIIDGLPAQTSLNFVENHANYRYDNYNIDGIEVLANTDKNAIGKLVITEHNAAKKIIGGTFEFKAVSPTTSEIYTITDGHFDLTYVIN